MFSLRLPPLQSSKLGELLRQIMQGETGLSRRRFLQFAAAASGYALLTGCYFPSGRVWTPPASCREVPEIDGEVRLAAVGDWGTDSGNQFDTLAGMEAASAALGGFHAGLLLGDNFYPHGVDDVDDKLFDCCFDKPFNTKELGNLTWHAVLGNHDWHGNVQAQIDYSQRNKRWSMPGHYYRKDFGASGTKPLLSVLAIDTVTDFEDWAKQKDWLESQLKELKSASWPRVVIGHHTLISYSLHGFTDYMVEEYRPLFEKYGVAAYVCGHDHGMQICEKNDVTYAVLGGGGASLYNLERGPLTKFSAQRHGYGVLRANRKELVIECRDTKGRLLNSHAKAAV